jgi:hypothetical protein
MKLDVLRQFTSKSLELIPSAPKGIGDFVSFKKDLKIEYYLFIKIEYYDDILKKKFYTFNVYKPSKLGPVFEEVEPNIKSEILNRYKNIKIKL